MSFFFDFFVIFSSFFALTKTYLQMHYCVIQATAFTLCYGIYWRYIMYHHHRIEKMKRIFDAICDIHSVRSVVEKNPQSVNVRNGWKWTPLDCAINLGRLEVAKYLWEKGGKPNLDIYCEGKYAPIHGAAYNGDTDTFEWVFTEGVLSLDVLKIKNDNGWTPLDIAIACDRLENAKYLWRIGGKPNLDIYRHGKWTPVHYAAQSGYIEILKWIFTEGVLPLSVLLIKNKNQKTPIDRAIFRVETATLLVDPIFLAMQRAKRDHHRTLLRRLPDELLDMVVDEVAARLHLKVVWFG